MTSRMRNSLVAVAIFGVLAGGGNSLRAQSEPGDGGGCDYNACMATTGNCTAVTHKFNCDETATTPGCSDSQC